MPSEEAAFLSAAELLAAYARRELSPVEATEATLRRIDRLNPTLNAYLCVDHEGALAAAREAERKWRQPGEKPLLCGVPISIKDILYTTWLPTTHGSLVFKDHHHHQNSPAVDRVLAAGAVVLGKTNTPEFGLLDVTRNRLIGEAVNPWDVERTAGGSSGGAGNSVAAAMGPLAIGTDGAGSIRIPAFYNGIYGLMPTFGRVAHDGWRGAPHTSRQGPMTRTVRDAVLLMQAISGPDARDWLCIPEPPPNFFDALDQRSLAGTRVAYSIDYGYMDVDPEIRQSVEDAARLLQQLGCELIESHPPRQEQGGGLSLSSPEEYAYARRIKPDFDEHFEELTDYGKRAIEAALVTPAWQFVDAVRRREQWAAAINRWFRDFDFFLAPVMSQPAPRCDAPHLQQKYAWPGNFLPIFNANGSPAASIPFGFHSNGMPLGVQIAGRVGDDAGVLRLSAAIEAARPWADRWPAIANEQHTERALQGASRQ
jgi:aspartyl-tRNA(Asn)/glutamyl-tRNA(Gln) amidotransferase subunit A